MWLAFRLLSPQYPRMRSGLPVVWPQSFSQLVWLRCAGMSLPLPLMAVKVVEGVVGGIEDERSSARARLGTPMGLLFGHATPWSGAQKVGLR